MDDQGASNSANRPRAARRPPISTSAIESVKELEREIGDVAAAIGRISGAAGDDGRIARALSDLAQRLAVEATGLRRRWEELAEVLETPGEESGDTGSGRLESAAKRDRVSGREASEGIRILVTQMAAAGVGRREIEKRLRADYGIKGARRLVNDVLAR